MPAASQNRIAGVLLTGYRFCEDNNINATRHRRYEYRIPISFALLHTRVHGAKYRFLLIGTVAYYCLGVFTAVTIHLIATRVTVSPTASLTPRHSRRLFSSIPISYPGITTSSRRSVGGDTTTPLQPPRLSI